ncbi:uncharacterized protein LOC114529397 isoform X2 [Dendronephthya gigantea]|uniref:uncharacterized protein LOC114529397 isoform X2 n=1 Tax=Dendronephthya gigantea TaxID=151771 RepID=UPI00106BEB3E|nr:uncharacterized protein LOC114529397 isoform X2 [Dendronephthya gigantea]
MQLFEKRKLHLYKFTFLTENVIIHFVTAWLAVRPLLSIPGILFPTFVNIFFILIIITTCVVQDLTLGALFSTVYIVIALYSLSIETTLLSAFFTLSLILGFQIVMGHYVVEKEQPILSEKQGDAVYTGLTIMNSLFLEPFHFSVLVLMRANLLPDLQWRSDLQLKRIMEHLGGKKSP